MLSFAWKDWERKASNFPPEVAFQLYSFHWDEMTPALPGANCIATDHRVDRDLISSIKQEIQLK